MAKKNVWQVVPAVLTLALVACEESLTGVVDPMVESEAVTSVAAAHQPAAPSDFIAWWPGELDFLDIGDRAYHIVRHQGVTTTDGGVVGQAYLFTGDAFGPKDSGQFLEINNNIDFEPTEFTIDLWALGLGDGQNASESILIEKAISNGEFGFRGNGPGPLLPHRLEGHRRQPSHRGRRGVQQDADNRPPRQIGERTRRRR